MRSPVAGNLLFVLPFCLLTLSGCSDRNDVVSDKESSQQKAEAMSTQKSANFVLTNGRIYTVNEDQPWAQAVAVDGNKIVYVGDNDGAKAFVGAGTESLDLEGRLVLPGFVESHIHLMLGAATSSGLTLTMTDSIDDVQRKLKEYADANREKKTLFGASYNAFLFDAKGPNKELLDKVVPDRPVLLMDHTIHSVWVNSKALEVAGITKETKDPPGGEYVRDENGEATGWIKGSPAHIPVIIAIEAITSNAIQSSLPGVLDGLTEFGFTSAMDMGNPIVTEVGLQAIVDLDAQDKLPLRLSMTHFVNTPTVAQTALEVQARYAKKYKSEHAWFDTLKITEDSVIENQKAAMLEPYLTTGDRGSLYFDQATLQRLVMGAAKMGHGTVIHCIGDWAVRETLDAAEALRQSGDEKTRFIATHAWMVQPEDRKRFGELDVIVQTTSNWANQQPSYVELIGQERNDTLQAPFRSWINGGAIVALGADWPATPGGFKNGVNPFNNIYVAMHRRVPKNLIKEFGSADRTLPPENEVLTLAEAIQGYTINGAKMLGIEDEIGSIEVGKKADMILLSQNLFEIDAEDIPKTKVLGTMFDGKIVHDLLYGIGDSNLVDLDTVGEGATGPCAHGKQYEDDHDHH